jgi:NAD(P)-dependent dehydrogenase (short-subunit alcohol dehydrogenase family)
VILVWLSGKSNAVSAELSDNIALITGAGRGIGRATALRLARAGCDLVLVARTRAELEAVAAEAAPSGVRTLVLPADVTDDAQVESALQRAVVQLGTISILVNNAGSAPPRTRVGKATVAEWDRVLATCLRAPMVLSRLLLPDMLAHKRGAIINIGSVAACTVRPGEAAYAAAKAGLVAFTRTLFAEVRDSGIKVAVICPGYVDTNLVPANRRVDRSRFLQPEDVAEAILQVLASDARVCPTEVMLEPQFDPEQP